MIPKRFLLAVLLASTACAAAARAAQDPIVLPTAVHTIDLNVGAAVTQTPMGVAWYPGLGGRYYATVGGTPTYPSWVFNATGGLLQTLSPTNVDCRSINYNWNTGNVEVVAYNAVAGGGLFAMGRLPDGSLTGTNTNVLGTLTGLSDDQNMPAYDSARNRFYSRASTTPWTVRVADRATGNLITTITLDTTGLGLRVVSPSPGSAPTPQGSSIGFDSTSSCLITVDTSRPRILVHRLDGSFVGASAFPASPVPPLNSTYGMGYANGQIFVNTNGGSAWVGYRFLDPPNASSSAATTAARQYALVACAVEPVDTTVAGHFGGPDTTAYRLGRYMPDRAAYSLAGTWYAGEGRELSGLRPGYGYWLITKSGGTTTINGSSTPTTWVLPLVNGPGATPGFNQLGNPFDVALPVASLRVRSGATQVYVTNAGNALTDQVVWTWNGSAYVSQSSGGSIPVGQGFWLRKNTAAAADVVAARPGVNPAPALLAGDGAETAADPRLWNVSLTVHQGDASSNALVLGAAALDRAGLDAISWPIPPAPPGGSLRLVARDGSATDLGTSFQVPNDRLSWDLVLSGAASPGEIALDVAASNLPPGDGLRLVDPANGATYALEAGRSVTLAAFAGERRLRLEVTASGTAALSPGAERPMRLAYPNPFHGDVGLTFAIARGGDVAVRVFDLQGRLVRSLERRGLAAGEHVLVWDGRDDAGVPARNGVYLARWSTPASSGTTRLVKVD